ncbi:ATP-dependent helicase [Pseudonocardia sp. D17]|uniref:ATP-dependent helicase n=1 Tax=Pseudonocardia sp. D17 TaxID=882661 RepID=UPI002B3688DE|nr:hypothetical protein PSD17_27580 [Pseudonocardia sp. D17]
MKKIADAIAELRANDRQWEAFTTAGHCVVLAPPGSGKTKLLTTRMAFDLAKRIPEPFGAACLTLTNAAADELRRRVASLGQPRRAANFIGTVHSFALNSIVIPFGRLCGVVTSESLSIADRGQEASAFDRAVDLVYPDRAHLPALARSTIEHARKRFEGPEDWVKHPEGLLNLRDAYLAELALDGLVDFVGLVEKAVDLVEGHAVVRQFLSAKFKWLYIDEYQDLTPGLHRLVEALCLKDESTVKLFAVGDPDQAILGFMGARPELLNDLAENKLVHKVPLEQNYRSGSDILSRAKVFKETTSLVTGDNIGGTVTAHYCPGGITKQCEKIVELTVEVDAAGTPLHEVVVIAPNNSICVSVVDVLRNAGLSAYFRNNEDYRLTQATAFVEACAAWALRGRETSGYRLKNLLRTWSHLLDSKWERRRSVRLVQLLLESSADISAAELIGGLMSAGLSLALTRPHLADDAVEVARMRAAVTSGRLSGLSAAKLAEHAMVIGRVEVTTMTSSKGLEFDCALILGVDKGRVPFFAAEKDPEQMREERRKFYVTLTRARKRVDICYSGVVEWSSGPRVTAPSPFLGELGLL